MSSIKSIIKSILMIFPLRITKHHEYKKNKLLNYLLAEAGEMVYSGPFASMPIPSDFLLSHELYYILGSYERCLHDEIYKLAASQPKYGIVVGAHKGYYSVGLLYITRNCKITAFESSEILHDFIKRWSEVAKVSNRIEICGTASIEALQNVQDAPDFLIIDCEGAEDFLLRPDLITWLPEANIICELHDFYIHKLLGKLIERFSKTHNIKIIESYPVSCNDYPLLNGLIELEAKNCVKEDRWILSNKDKSSKIWTTGRFLIAHPITS